MPKRVQMTRQKGGWRAENPNAVIVSRPGLFCNPWRAAPNAPISTDDTKRGPVGEVAVYDHRGIWTHYQTCPHAESVEAVVALFESWVRGNGIGGLPSGLTRDRLEDWRTSMVKRRERLLARLPSLHGRDLACWCPLDQPCHADVLLELANAEGRT